MLGRGEWQKQRAQLGKSALSGSTGSSPTVPGETAKFMSTVVCILVDFMIGGLKGSILFPSFYQ